MDNVFVEMDIQAKSVRNVILAITCMTISVKVYSLPTKFFRNQLLIPFFLTFNFFFSKLVIVTFLDLWMTHVMRKVNVPANLSLLEISAKNAWINMLVKIVTDVLILSMDTQIAQVKGSKRMLWMNVFWKTLLIFSDCNCYKRGSHGSNCDNTGQCQCISNFSGKKCFECAFGYFSISNACLCKYA